MKEDIIAIVSKIDNTAQKMNILREYLQAFSLRVLHEVEAFSSIAFVGGTALRFLNNIPRFSEDLDFSLTSIKGYNPVAWLKKIKTELSYAGFQAEVTWNDQRVINSSWIKIIGILKEAELSDRVDHKLSIKIEIDTNPPTGAEIKKTLVTRHLTFALAHYDLTSLMAGKIHALLSRKYHKGRDWYDLVWYCSKRPPVSPNLILLQNALNQTFTKDELKADDWQNLILQKLETVNEDALIQDISPFLERPNDVELLKVENIKSLFHF